MTPFNHFSWPFSGASACAVSSVCPSDGRPKLHRRCDLMLRAASYPRLRFADLLFDSFSSFFIRWFLNIDLIALSLAADPEHASKPDHLVTFRARERIAMLPVRAHVPFHPVSDSVDI